MRTWDTPEISSKTWDIGGKYHEQYIWQLALHRAPDLGFIPAHSSGSSLPTRKIAEQSKRQQLSLQTENKSLKMSPQLPTIPFTRGAFLIELQYAFLGAKDTPGSPPKSGKEESKKRSIVPPSSIYEMLVAVDASANKRFAVCGA